MDIIVPQIQPIQDTSTPRYNTFNEATFGAGATQVKINSDGFFVGGENFESAPFSVDYNGRIIAESIVLGEGSVGTIQLQDDSVISSKIVDSAITPSKLSIAAINPVDGEINENKVGTLQINTNAVTEEKILNDAITASKLNVSAIDGAGDISANAVTATAISAGAVTAEKILAGAVTASKMTTLNFMVSSGAFSHNSPSAGYVSWAGIKVVYNGVEYSVTDGNTNNNYIYWQLSNPTAFQADTSLPSLGNDDFLVATNSSGSYILVWNSTTVNGNRITTGTITSTQLSTGELITNTAQIKDAIITSAKISSINADTITAGTITGRTIKATGGTGVDVWIDSSDGQIKFHTGGGKIGYMSGGYSQGGDKMVEIQADEYIQLRTTNGSIFALVGNEFGVVVDGGVAYVCKDDNVEVYDDLVAFHPYYSFVNGTKEGGNSGTYYVATSSGGSANHKIKFAGGIMVDG